MISPPSRRWRSPTPSIGRPSSSSDDVAGADAGRRRRAPARAAGRPRGRACRPTRAATGSAQRPRAADDAEEGAPDAAVDDQRVEDPAASRRRSARPGRGRSPATAVLIPTTRPRESASAPPELPGLSAASVWMTFSTRRLARPSRVAERPAEGADDAGRHGAGEPERVADRDDQLADASAGRRRRAVRPCRPPPVVRTTARSDSGSRPTTSNGSSAPSTNVAVPRSAAGDDVGRRHEVAVRARWRPPIRRRRRPAADLAGHPQAGDRRDEPLGRGADRDRVGVEELVVVRRSASGRRTGPVGAPARPWRSGLAGGRGAAADRDGPLVGAADDLDLERDLERRERRLEVVGIGDRPCRRPRRSGRRPRIPAAAAGLPSSTPRTRTPSRSGSPTDRRRRRADVRRRHGDTEARPRRRLAAAERVDPVAQRRVGRQGEVEALADPVRVEADEPARRVEQRPARRAGRERRGVLDAAARSAGRPGPRNARAIGRHEAERDPRAAAVASPRPRRRRLPTDEVGAVAPRRPAPRRPCRRR